METWEGVQADLAITDPPFGIDFGAGKGNYNRDEGNVVDGYVEWKDDEYLARVETLADVLAENVVDGGHALVFSGWNNSHQIRNVFSQHDIWRVEGKLYWEYNFAPYTKRRPAHNVYEIFWMVKGDDWYYSNECNFEHCQSGEANLSAIPVNREYLPEQEKYPTRLPPEVVMVLFEHYTEPGDVVFDPLAGSGMVGLAAIEMGREYFLGDINTEAKRIFEDTITNLYGDTGKPEGGYGSLYDELATASKAQERIQNYL